MAYGYVDDGLYVSNIKERKYIILSVLQTAFSETIINYNMEYTEKQQYGTTHHNKNVNGSYKTRNICDISICR